jgi:DNA mismatch repair protein MutS
MEQEKKNLPPMLKQYFDIKKDYPDAILFFRMGDFNEMFFDDARIAAPVLEVGVIRDRWIICFYLY